MTPELKNEVTVRAVSIYILVRTHMIESAPPEKQRLAEALWEWFPMVGVEVPRPEGDTMTWFLDIEKTLWATALSRGPELFSSFGAGVLARVSGSRLIEHIQDMKLSSQERALAGFMVGAAVGAGQLTVDDFQRETQAWDAVPCAPALPVATGEVLSRSQQSSLERIVALGELFFSGTHNHTSLKPRCFPLLCGPTGVGKSRLTKQAAEHLEAYYLPLSFARFIPLGVREYQPTLFAIMEAARNHERVLVHLDELDKIQAFSNDSWSKCVVGDVFATLDRDWPFKGYRKHAGLPETEADPQPPRVFYVASGTWQTLTGAQVPRIGFGGAAPAAVTGDRIRNAKIIPEELLARFHSELIMLSYPAPDEVPRLLEAYGLNQLAARAGVTIDPATVDFSLGGMRVFEALSSDLLLRIQAMGKEVAPRA